jgi:hypothetical protein
MATWYKISKVSVRIEAVDVERHTDSCVYVRGRQFKRYTSYDCYFQTWEEARSRLVERYLLQVKYAEAALRHAKNDLESAMSLAQAPKIEFGLGVGQ